MKRAFTLLELLLVIFLVSISLGCLGIGLPKAFKEQKFKKEIEKIKNQLVLAQEIMLDYDSDVTFKITSKKGKLYSNLLVFKPLPVHLQKILCKTLQFQEIHQMFWEKQEVNLLMIHFKAQDGLTPKGALTLKNGNKRETLLLEGFPKRIVREKYETNHFSHQKIPEPRYPKEALSST